MDLGAVEKELTEFTEMHRMVQNELEATEELYKVAEDKNKKGLAYAPQNFTKEQLKEVDKILDEMHQEDSRVTRAMFRTEQGAMEVAKKSNFTPKNQTAVEKATADAQTDMKEEHRKIENIPGEALALMG